MENMQCNDTVDIALAELIGLQSRGLHYTPGTTTISSSPSFGLHRKFLPHFSCQSIASPSVNHQRVQMHSKYISKILNNPRNASEVPPFRMRPYFIPERSRTKSESLDLTSSTLPDLGEGSGTDSESLTLSSFGTCTTNSASYSMMSATLMDTGGGSSSRSPGILLPQCSFDYENVNEARAGFGEPRRMRLKLLNVLKKSKSLEDVRAEPVDGSQLAHEMEFVSSRIQKLKVQEQE